MTDLFEIGFVYTGGMEPLIRDTKTAKEEVEDLDKAQASLKRTEAQAEKVAGRLAMSLREKNNVLKAGIKGTRESIIAAKQENLANRLRAQGVDEKLIPSLQKLQKENLKLEETYRKSGKALGQSSVKMGQASIQLEQFLNQIQGGANPLLAFSQQSADLGIVLGLPLLGAVLGITGALVSFLGPALLDITDKTKALEKANDELSKSFSRLASGAGSVDDSFEQLRKQDAAIGILAVSAALSDARNQLRKTDKAIEDFIESIDVLEAFRVNGIGFGFSNLDDFATRLDKMGLSVEAAASKLEGLSITAGDRLAGNFSTATQRLVKLKDETDEIADKFKLTDLQALTLGKSLGDLQNNVTYEGLDTLKTTLTGIATSAQGNSFEFQKLTKDLLQYIKAVEDGKDSYRLFKQEALGVNTALRLDDDDSLSELQDKLNEINLVLSKAAPEAQEVYLKMIAKLSQGIKELTEEEITSNKARLQAEILVQGTLGKSVEAQEADNWALSKGIVLSKERRNELIELLKVLNQPAETESYQESVRRLEDQILALTHGSAAVSEMNRQREMQIQVDRLYAVGLGELGLALEHQFEKYRRLKSAVDATAASQKRFTDGLKESSNLLKDIAGTMDGVGNRIATSFSQGLDAITQFTSKSFELADAQKENSANLEFYNGKQDKTKADLMEIARLEEEKSSIQADNFQNQLSGIGSILGASKNLFDEQSKERKVLHALEMGFLVAEIALATQKAITNAAAAITAAGTLPPPASFASIAAMTAIMAGVLGGIGAALSSGGGSAPSMGPVGTGTVFGDEDAQSESLTKSFEAFEDIQLDQLAELKGIRQGLGTLSGAINQVTRSIVSAGGLDTGFVEGLGETRNGGVLRSSAAIESASAGQVIGYLLGGAPGALLGTVLGPVLDKLTGGIISGLVNGLFGSTKTELVDSGIQFLSQSFADIIESGAVEANIFAVIKSTTKKAFGLIRSSDFSTQLDPVSQEFAEALGGIFVTMADTLASAGEVLGITTKTFANGVSKDLMESLEFLNLEAGGISLEGLSGEEIEKELSAFFSSMGDSMAEFLFPQLLQYQQINEGMFETVLRVTRETAIFNDSIKALGVSMSNSSAIGFGQAVIEASGGLENFTESFNTFYDEFFTEQEKAENTLRSITEVFATLGLTVPDTMEEYRALVEETAAMGSAGADTLAILLEVSGAFAAMSETLADVEASSREASRSFADITTLLDSIGTPSNTDILLGAGGSSEAAREKLVEDFGSAGAFGESFLSFANNFLGAEESLEVASETLASTMSGLFVEVTGQVADTAAEQNLIELKNKIRMGSTTSDDLIKFFSDMINGVRHVIDSEGNLVSEAVEGITSLDIESGLLTGLLQVQPALNDYITLLQQQEQALESASTALELQQEGLLVGLLEAQGKASQALAIQRAREIKSLQELDEANREMGLDSNLAELQAVIFMQEDYNTALQESQDQVSSTYNTLNEAITTQKSVLNDTLSDLVNARGRIANALRRQDVTLEGGFNVAFKELQETIVKAGQGDFSTLGDLDLGTLTAGDTSGFSSITEFQLSQAVVEKSLRELDAIVAEQESEVLSEIDVLNAQLGSAKEQHDTLLNIEEFDATTAETSEYIAELMEQFNTDSAQLAALQVAATGEQLTEEQQEALTQVLIEAQGLSFQALMDLTEEQQTEMVEHLLSLIGRSDTTSSILDASFELLRLDLAGLTSSVESLLVPLESLLNIDLSTQYMKDSLVNDDRRKVSLPNSHYKNQEAMIEALKDISFEIPEMHFNNQEAMISAISSISLTSPSLPNENIIMVDLDTLGITSELTKINDTLRELTSNQWHQNRGTLPKIVAATEYLRDSLINDDRRKVSLPNSHYKGLFAIQDATEYLRDSLINDDRRKVSLPNSHYKHLIRGADASEYLVNSLINDDRRKVSLPNSHYNNQTALISEVQGLREDIVAMKTEQNAIAKANLKANLKTYEVNQRMEINGIDVNETSTA